MVATSSQLIIHDSVSSDMVCAAAASSNDGIVLSMIKNWLRMEVVVVHGAHAPAEALSLLEHGEARVERRWWHAWR
uniref:Uncharacterized protein n=1 Tax=Oryza meridionalis TaxID=40149 RepID=A0A0E0F1T3_9ORYZ